MWRALKRIRSANHASRWRVATGRGMALCLATALAFGMGMTDVSQAQALGPSGCVFTLAGGGKPQCPDDKENKQKGLLAPVAVASTPAPAVAAFVSSAPIALPPKSALAPASSATIRPPALEHPQWDLRLQDVTLAAVFHRWAGVAGWRVLWDVDKHLLIDAPDVYLGSFEQVVSAVLSSPGLVQGPYPLEVCFYPNTPPLARITRRGEQSRDCK